MNFGSVCSGIGAPEVAWQGLGWRCVFQSEIEPFPRAVLAHRFGAGMDNGPKLFGDFTKIREADIGEPIDLLVGGTPCQSFSVAGKRLGLDDPRGNLALEFLALARRLGARWIVWENVPGVRSSDCGRDFGTFLGLLGECGYGWAYRSLDAQYAGLAQRRERVFVVGCLGDWRRAAAVLFEPEGLRWDSPPSREAGERVADSLTVGANQYSGFCGSPVASHDPACTLTARDYKGPLPEADLSTVIAHSLRADGFDASEDGTGRGTPLVAQCFDWQSGGDSRGLDPKETAQLQRCQVPAVCFTAKDHGADAGEIAPTLRAGGHTGSHANAGVMPAVAWSIMPQNSGKDYKARAVEVAQPVMAGGPVGGNQGGDYIQQGYAVRRLTPVECEKLQGLPPDWTLVPYRNGMAKDGPRYKAIGNSMAVPVIGWIGERIAMMEAL